MTGTGFTTGEAELVVNHPRRRRIIAWLIVLGNVSIIATLISLIITVRSDMEVPSMLFIVIVASVIVIIILSIWLGILRRINDAIVSVVSTALGRKLLVRNEILHQVGSYGVVRVAVSQKAAETGMTIGDTGLIEGGVTILAIERKDKVLPFPGADERIQLGDQLLCYGEVANIPGLE
jgi:hypothetical protein